MVILVSHLRDIKEVIREGISNQRIVFITTHSLNEIKQYH